MKTSVFAFAVAVLAASPAFASTWWVGDMPTSHCTVAPVSPGDIVDQMNGEVVMKHGDEVDVDVPLGGSTKNIAFFRNKEACDRAMSQFKDETGDLH
jgi:hypothetical protein